jgi:hypothetical protein
VAVLIPDPNSRELAAKNPGQRSLKAAVPWTVWTTMAAIICWRRFRYGFDVDELEHLHVAWEVAKGRLIYRDFFEHHPPVLYCLAAPIVGRMSRLTVGVLVFCRAFGVGVTLMTAALQYMLMRRFLPRPVAAWGLVFCLLLCPLPQKLFDFRPDWLAMTLFLAAVLLLHAAVRGKGAGRLVQAAAAGVVVGLASLTSQKVWPLALACGLWAMLACIFADRSDRAHRCFAAGLWAAGGSSVVALGVAIFAARHAAGSMIGHVLILNIHWPAEISWKLYGSITVLAGLIPLSLAMAAAAARILAPGQRLRRAKADLLVAYILLFGVAAYCRTPAPWDQSVIFLITTWAGMLAAVEICRLAAKRSISIRDLSPILLASALCLSAVSRHHVAVVAAFWIVVAIAAVFIVRQSKQRTKRVHLACALLAAASIVGYARLEMFHPLESRRTAEFAAATRLAALQSKYPRLLICTISAAPFRSNPTYNWYMAPGITATADAEYSAALKAGTVDAVTCFDVNRYGDYPLTRRELQNAFIPHDQTDGQSIYVRDDASRVKTVGPDG